MRPLESQDHLIVALYPSLVGLTPVLRVCGWFFIVACSLVALDDPVFGFGIASGILLLLFAKVIKEGTVTFDRGARVVRLPKRFLVPARNVPFDELLCLMTTTYVVRARGLIDARHWTIELIEKQTEPLLYEAVRDASSTLGADSTAVSTPRLTYAVEQFLFDGKKGRTLLVNDTVEHVVVALHHSLSTFAGLSLLDTCNDPPRLYAPPRD